MAFLYFLGLIPPVAMYYFARSRYTSVRRRFRLPSSVLDAHFVPQLVGWGIGAMILWFFVVSFAAQAGDPDRIMWLLLAPVAFAIGEAIGLMVWSREMHQQLVPRTLSNGA